MAVMAKAGIQFSKKDEWYTPKEVVDLFGHFDYDPCTTLEQAKYLGIEAFDTIISDGLKTNWNRYKRIWVNPPFTKKFDFLEKAVNTTSKVFFLLPIETLTTKRFHEIMQKVPYALWVPDGRVKFQDVDKSASSPAFGSVVIELKTPTSEIRHWTLPKTITPS